MGNVQMVNCVSRAQHLVASPQTSVGVRLSRTHGRLWGG